MSLARSIFLLLLYSLTAGVLPVGPLMAADEPAAARNTRKSAPRVGLAGSPRLGRPDARIGIVEFSDYQCPACRGFHIQLYPALKAKYIDTGIVQLIHKDFPLTANHQQALRAAQAANCAWAQNRFWEMNHALYLNQDRLGANFYLEQARHLKLNEKNFSNCLEHPASLKGIALDTAVALELGVSATPSFVIGIITGDALEVISFSQGMPDFSVFADEIEKLRKAMSSGASRPTK